MSDEVLTAATDKMVLALAKTVAQVRDSFAREHGLSAADVSLVIGTALLRNASMSLSASIHADANKMSDLTKRFKQSFADWCNEQKEEANQ